MRKIIYILFIIICFSLFSQTKLQRFGEDFFKIPSTTFAPVLNVPVGPNYILGPGDEIIIEIWGMIEGRKEYTIDREGGIYIPKIGRIYLWGLTFKEAEKLIKKKYKEYYKKFEINIVLGKLRTIKVFVVGEAKKPGDYEVSSLSTAFNVLYLSGGPTSTGSYRRIQLIRENKIIGEIDTYEFLLTGKKNCDYKLQSEDIIFIPLSGPQVSVSGEVKRPRIYELKNEKKLSEVIKLAGGVKVNAYGGRIQVERVENYQKRIILDIKNVTDLFEGGKNKDIELKDGDLIRVYSVNPKIYNKIELAGLFKYPGTYEWKPGMKLSDFIKKENILPEAYLEYGEIERKELPSGKLNIIPFSPQKILEGNTKADTDLLPLDKIVLRSKLKKTPSIEIKGEVKIPGKYSISKGEKLSSVLERAGGYTEEAFLKGAVFTRVSVRETQKKLMDELVKQQQQMILTQLSSFISPSPEKGVSEKTQVLKEMNRLISSISSKIPLGRVFIKLDEIDKLENSSYDLILKDGDTLYIPKPPMSVSIVGGVRNPGAIVYLPEKTVDYYIEKCGGFSENADVRNIYIIKADGTAVTKFARLKKVEQGDMVIVPEKIKLRGWALTKEIIDMFYKIAMPVAVYSR